jgi:glycosyltransferase involved in cell wall biosynthesis
LSYIFIITSNKLTGCSNEAGSYFFGNKITNTNKFSVSYNAINLEKYRYNIFTREKLRKKYRVDGCKVIGYVGRFSNEKGIEFLLSIFSELIKIDCDYRLLLIGGSGNRVSEVEKFCNGIYGKYVIKTGVVPNVNEYLQMMDLYLGPSLYEGLGISFIESQAAGLMCVASDVIPVETKVTNKIKIISLKKTKIEWAVYINEIINYKRYDTYLEMNKSEYSIAKAIRKIYLLYGIK